MNVVRITLELTRREADEVLRARLVVSDKRNWAMTTERELESAHRKICEAIDRNGS